LVVGLEVPKEELDRRIESRTRAMFEAGVEDEVRRALDRPISATASKILGLDEVATLPREDAIAAIVARTRRYAAYQRKWMRRISDLATVAADRPPGDVADDILALGRQREHLSPRRER
jgi:tRNA dimethylallyltransferase